MSGGAGHKLEMGGVERSCRLALRSAQRLADGGEIGVDRRLHRVLAAELLGAQQQAVGGERVMLHAARSEEHTSELQSLMRISYAVFCLKKKKQTTQMKRISHNNTENIKNTVKSA